MRKTRRGLSLVDVVFTASLLAIVFMVLLSLLPAAMLSIRQTEHRLTAGSLAQHVLDECRSRPFSLLAANQVVDITTAGPLGDILRQLPTRGDDAVEFATTLKVEDSPHSTVPRDTLAMVTVEVKWHERGQDWTLERTAEIAKINR